MKDAEVLSKLDAILTVTSGLPNAEVMELAIIKGIKAHEEGCAARLLPIKVAENTGILKTLRAKARTSIAPVGRVAGNLPRWAQITIGILSASGVGTAIAAAL